MNSQYEHSFGPQNINSKFGKQQLQPNTISQHRVIFCQLHHNYNIKLVCVEKNCPLKGLLCDQCIHDHKDHAIYTIDQFIGMYKDSILVQNSVQKLESQIEILNQVQKNIQKQVNNLNTQINDFLEDFNQKVKAINKKDQILFVNTRDQEQRIYTWLEQLQYKQITNYDDAQYIIHNLLLRSDLKQPDPTQQNQNNKLQVPYFEINNLSQIDNNLKMAKILSKQEQIQTNIIQNSQKFLSDLQKYFDTLYTQIKNTSDKNQNNFSNRQYIDRIEANLNTNQQKIIKQFNDNIETNKSYTQNSNTYVNNNTNNYKYTNNTSNSQHNLGIESKHTINSNDYSIKKPQYGQNFSNQYTHQQEIHTVTTNITNTKYDNQLTQNQHSIHQQSNNNNNFNENNAQQQTKKQPIFQKQTNIEKIDLQYQNNIQNNQNNYDVSQPKGQPFNEFSQNQQQSNQIFQQNQKFDNIQQQINQTNISTRYTKKEEQKNDESDEEEENQNLEDNSKIRSKSANQFQVKELNMEQINTDNNQSQKQPQTPNRKSHIGKLMGDNSPFKTQTTPTQLIKQNFFKTYNQEDDPDFGENSNPRTRMYQRAIQSRSRSRSPAVSPRRSANHTPRGISKDIQKVSTQYRTSYTAHKQSVNDIVFIDGDKIATASVDNTVRLFDKTEGKLIICLEGHQASVECLAYQQSSKILASGSVDQTVIIWRPVPQWEQVQILKGHQGPVKSLTFFSAQILYSLAQQQLKIWNIESEEDIQDIPLKNVDLSSSANCMLLHQNNQCLIMGVGKRLNIFDTKKYLKLKDIDAHQAQITYLLRIKRKADQPFIVSSSKDGQIKLWEGNTMILFRSLQDNQPILSMTYIIKEDQLVCGLGINQQHTEGKLAFWKLDTLKKQYELNDNTTNPNKILYDSYNDLIFTCHQNGQVEYYKQDPQKIK